jgi:hypothetical protein
MTLSPDGRWVLFEVPQAGVMQPAELLDLHTGGLIALPATNLLAPGTFSADGRRLLTRSGTSYACVVSVFDMTTVEAAGGEGSVVWQETRGASVAALSADGARLAVPSKSNIRVLTVLDLGTGSIVYSSRLSGFSFSLVLPEGALNADGRFVLWSGSDTNALWRGDADTDITTDVHVGVDGSTSGNGHALYPSQSPDGRWVIFASLADNLVPGDNNRVKDVFVRDTRTGRTLLLSRGISGEPGSGWSTMPFFTANGSTLFFLSHAPDLVANDRNGSVDVFRVDLADLGMDLFAALERNVADGTVILRWSGKAGKRYRVEAKRDLSDTAWLPIEGAAVDGTFGIDPSADRRFFRLVEEP